MTAKAGEARFCSWAIAARTPLDSRCCVVPTGESQGREGLQLNLLFKKNQEGKHGYVNRECALLLQKTTEPKMMFTSFCKNTWVLHL